MFTQAGGALDLRIQTKMHDFASRRGGRFFVMYGQTEASPRMATLRMPIFPRKAGSVGVALAGGRLSIVDDKGLTLPPGAVGAVVYEGPNVMLGYAMSRADLGKGDEMKGRLETGDLGRLDGEGFLDADGPRQAFRQDRRIPPRPRRNRTGARRRLPGRLSRSWRRRSPSRTSRNRKPRSRRVSVSSPTLTRCRLQASRCARSSKSRAPRAAKSIMRA